MSQVSLAGLTLHVADLERSVAFYQKLPGAEVQVFQPGLFAMVRIGAGRIGLLQRAAGRFHVELEVEDLDAYYEQVREAGIQPKGPPVKHPWGERDFVVVDPDGFQLEFEAAEGNDPSGLADPA
jgi:catechol 2,3-dioxygenase-like lactoylglutathione lyase family enzyme